MLKKLIKCAIAVVIAFNLTSCVAISIKEKQITAMNIMFKDYYGKGYAYDTLVPGNTYKVEVQVYVEGKDKPIKHPSFDDMNITVNENLAITKESAYTLRVLAYVPDGTFLFDSSYQISLGVIDNDFGGVKKTFRTDWASYNYLDYSGADGWGGSMGATGDSGHRYGYTGGNGGRGADGPNLDLEAAYLYSTDKIKLPDGLSRMIFVYDKAKNRHYLIGASQLTVDVSGGDGGKGGKGGTGARGDSREYYPIDGGMGGVGGIGGHGGNGGHLMLYVPEHQTTENSIKANISGGRGGAAGEGGDGGMGAYRVYKNSEGKIIRTESGRSGSKGYSGVSGVSGLPGSYYYKHVPLDSMFYGCTFLNNNPEVREMMKK